MIAGFETKKPKHDRPATTFFMDATGQPIRDDPTQPKLPLSVVPAHDDDGVIIAVND